MCNQFTAYILGCPLSLYHKNKRTKMETNQEMPELVFWRLLPFIAQKDMLNVGLAVKASPSLYHQYSLYTKKDSKKDYPKTPLICPYCLIQGNHFNPWHKILNCVFTQHQRTWAAADAGLTLFDSENRTIVESQSLADLKEKLVEPDAPSVVQATPENRYRRWTKIWSEDYPVEKKANRLLIAIKDLQMFNYAFELVEHIESAHHPTGRIWKSLERPIQRLGQSRIRAFEIDELISLIDAKKYQNSIVVTSPRKNQNFKNAFKAETSIRRRRYGQDRRYLNPPTSFLTSGVDKVQNLHRTLALAYLLEDKLQRSNRQYMIVPQKYHKLLALRNYLACQQQVYEDLEFGHLSQDNACYFGLINAIKIILDSIFKLPY